MRLWDAKTGALQQTFEGHSGYVQSVTFSLDGRRLASISGRAVQLWDVETGALQQTPEGYFGLVRAVAFSPDGWRLITDQGSIDLRASFLNSNQATIWSSYSLSEDRNWITWKGHNVLWLPPEYRPVCVMFQDNALAMGYSSGRVIIIGVEPDVNPLKG